MGIDLQGILNSQFGVRLVSYIGRTIPPAAGYRIAGLVAEWLAGRRESLLVRAIRLNQWVVRGTGLDKEALDQCVRDVLRHSAHSLYDLHHYVHYPEVAQTMIDLNPVAQGLVERCEFNSHGLMLVGLHLSNFDLVLQSMCLQGLKAFVLTIPEPQGGRRTEYEMRKRTGMHLVPASLSAMRDAVHHLQRGGVVLTGMDRPIPEPKTQPRFFGHPSYLPTHHIHLAIKAKVPVMIIAARLGADMRYHVTTSEPIEMESVSAHEKAIEVNAERVLKEAEKFILQTPEQWGMSLPVWPDFMDDAPA